MGQHPHPPLWTGHISSGHIGSSQWASGCLPLKHSPEHSGHLSGEHNHLLPLGLEVGGAQAASGQWVLFAGQGLSLLSFGLELIMGCSYLFLPFSVVENMY